MVLYYLLLAPFLSLWYSIIFYCLTAYTYGTLLSSNGPYLSLLYSNIFYWPNAYTYGTLLSSTGSLLIPMILYYLLLSYCLYLWYSTSSLPMGPVHLLGTLLSSSGPMPILWYSTVFYWLPAYTYGTLLSSTGSLPIPMVLYHLLLPPVLYLWYSTTFYWLPAYTYGTLLY